MCECERKQWAGHLRGFLSGEQNGGGRGNRQRPRDKETGREGRDQSRGDDQSGLIEQEETAQTQSWTFLAWDSNSRDSSCPKRRGLQGLVNRGKAVPYPASVARRPLLVLKAPAAQLPYPWGRPFPPPQRPAQPRDLPLSLSHYAGPGVPAA